MKKLTEIDKYENNCTIVKIAIAIFSQSLFFHSKSLSLPLLSPAVFLLVLCLSLRLFLSLPSILCVCFALLLHFFINFTCSTLRPSLLFSLSVPVNLPQDPGSSAPSKMYYRSRYIRFKRTAHFESINIELVRHYFYMK